MKLEVGGSLIEVRKLQIPAGSDDQRVSNYIDFGKYSYKYLQTVCPCRLRAISFRHRKIRIFHASLHKSPVRGNMFLTLLGTWIYR